MRDHRVGVPAVLLAGALALAAPVVPPIPAPRAEHAVAFRYTVLGYVTDADGRARAGVRVELSRQKTGFSYLGETGPDGFYVIIARLGDESAGETLSLRADSQAVILIARFEPVDHSTERGTRVDFTDRRPVESPTQFAGTLKRFLAQ